MSGSSVESDGFHGIAPALRQSDASVVQPIRNPLEPAAAGLQCPVLDAEDMDAPIKSVVIGPPGSGKTSLVWRLLHPSDIRPSFSSKTFQNQWDASRFHSTMGVECSKYPVGFGSQGPKGRLSIFDTGGRPEIQPIAQVFGRGCHVVYCVFDARSARSLDKLLVMLHDWMPALRFTRRSSGMAAAAVVLTTAFLANFSEFVPASELLMLRNKIPAGSLFFEVDAATGKNVNRAFLTASRDAWIENLLWMSPSVRRQAAQLFRKDHKQIADRPQQVSSSGDELISAGEVSGSRSKRAELQFIFIVSGTWKAAIPETADSAETVDEHIREIEEFTSGGMTPSPRRQSPDPMDAESPNPSNRSNPTSSFTSSDSASSDSIFAPSPHRHQSKSKSKTCCAIC
eukprot:ANDGO_00019.mRNA.1 GTP-binding protein ypt4